MTPERKRFEQDALTISTTFWCAIIIIAAFVVLAIS